MTDKEFRNEQKRVQKAFDRWKEITGLGDWIIYHYWHRDGTAGKGDSDRPNTAGWTTAARVEVSWEYIHATFHWNLHSLQGNTDLEMDRIVRHEIAHVLVNEMRQWAPERMDQDKLDEAHKHEERVVSRLASVLKWCRAEGQKEASSKPKKKGKR